VTALATVETERLAKLIRLVFSSDQAGEVTAAVTAVRRILAAAGLDAHALADIVEHGTKSIAVPHVDRVDDDDGDDRSAIWFAYHRRYSLTPRDRQFIEGLTRWRGPLSIKQQKWLRDVCDTLAEATA
jgi:DNA-binding transcriptional LysR family regulator